MKLRFRNNSLRLRLNQREVESVSNGEALEERIDFPGDATLSYRLRGTAAGPAAAALAGSVITISVPSADLRRWRQSDDIGLYFRADMLDVAIEKDLVCTDGPPEELDPHAFPRTEACR